MSGPGAFLRVPRTTLVQSGIWRLMGTLLVLSLPATCAHTRSVGPTESQTTMKDGQPDHARADPAPSPRVAPRAPQQQADATAHQPATDHSTSANGSGVPIAMSPAGLLKEHAIDDIQEKLQSTGHLSSHHHPSGKLDEPTREALRAFQRERGLPATGIPDDLTVQKLGLRPGDVFRAASP